MRKVLITSDCFIPAAGEPGTMKTAYTGSVLEVEDHVAIALLAAQRAEAAADDAKLVDMTSKREPAKKAAAASEQQTPLV